MRVPCERPALPADHRRTEDRPPRGRGDPFLEGGSCPRLAVGLGCGPVSKATRPVWSGDTALCLHSRSERGKLATQRSVRTLPSAERAQRLSWLLFAGKCEPPAAFSYFPVE